MPPIWSLKRKTSTRFHRVRIDLVDDRLTVRSVLGDGDPDELAVEVDAARVVHRAFAQSVVRQQFPVRPDLEQMSLALSGIAIVSVAQLG